MTTEAWSDAIALTSAPGVTVRITAVPFTAREQIDLADARAREALRAAEGASDDDLGAHVAMFEAAVMDFHRALRSHLRVVSGRLVFQPRPRLDPVPVRVRAAGAHLRACLEVADLIRRAVAERVEAGA
jgi:hypothetical protein